MLKVQPNKETPLVHLTTLLSLSTSQNKNAQSQIRKQPLIIWAAYVTLPSPYPLNAFYLAYLIFILLVLQTLDQIKI